MTDLEKLKEAFKELLGALSIEEIVANRDLMEKVKRMSGLIYGS